MKKLILIVFTIFTSTSYSQSINITISQLVNTIELIDFRPVQRFKQFDRMTFKKYLYSEVDANLLTQLNIDARYLCKDKTQEGFEVYNLYYKKITKEKYALYCKEINILMEMDGVIKQPK